MKIAISSLGNDLDAPFSPIFGRCPVYIIVDTDTMAFHPLPNQAQYAPGGAGIQAAQEVARQGVGAVVTGNIGPNAYRVLASAGIAIYMTNSAGNVRQIVESFKAGRLSPISSPTGPAHAGMGFMRGVGMGRGSGAGSQKALGARGYGFRGPAPFDAAASQATPTGPECVEEDVSSLKAEIKSIRERLNEISNRIDDLKQ